MKNQDSISSSKSDNSMIESKDNELIELSDREFRSLLLKIINDFKNGSNKQINKVRTTIQD
jgi:hypothetical protein